MATDEAYLSSSEKYTIFRYGDHVIRFLAPYSLERYIDVKEWDKGYLVVNAKYGHMEEPEEEYIDLVPILNSLYFDSDNFLDSIKKVKVCYD